MQVRVWIYMLGWWHPTSGKQWIRSSIGPTWRYDLYSMYIHVTFYKLYIKNTSLSCRFRGVFPLAGADSTPDPPLAIPAPAFVPPGEKSCFGCTGDFWSECSSLLAALFNGKGVDVGYAFYYIFIHGDPFRFQISSIYMFFSVGKYFNWSQVTFRMSS